VSAKWLDAARASQPARLARVLAGDVDTNGRYDEWTLLAAAASKGRSRNVELLLHRGADRDAVAYGARPLHWALRARANIGNAELEARVRTAELLLDAGADPHAADAWGRTVFWYACNLARGKAKGLVARLLTTGPDLLAIDHEGFSILHMAVSWDHLEVLDGAIAAGGDVNARFEGGKQTAVALAVARGHHEALRRILAAGATPNVGGDPEASPLALAVWRDDLISLELLLDHGAEVEWMIAEIHSGRRTALSAAKQAVLLEQLERHRARP